MSEATIIGPKPVHHSWIEDVLALLTGTLLVSFGAILLGEVGALTGSTAGMAFLINYLTPMSFGLAFFLINIPFYILALKKMGVVFTLKTFATVTLVSLFTHVHPSFIQLGELDLFYATLFGNLLMGTGFVVLFRHGASLGGVTILALYVQDKTGFRAGYLQMGVDVLVVCAAFFVVSIPALIASVLGAVLLNILIAFNHRKDRYLA
ncbi:YitT family protein [Alteromonas gilva]|uniref:YitT family protein n=1 Tax=Alteromonas gilva TaxID=2987522 RepID=A0ABT5L514_9ALTE|nr:YitT family protein [Alteromonas gilva]MDC8831947.1 YitT family protein [Alteromonas gilva]